MIGGNSMITHVWIMDYSYSVIFSSIYEGININ